MSLAVLAPVLGPASATRARIAVPRAGTFGYTVRVVPTHPMLASDAELGLVAYARA